MAAIPSVAVPIKGSDNNPYSVQTTPIDADGFVPGSAADGKIVSIGAKADPVYTDTTLAAAGSVVAILKAVFGRLVATAASTSAGLPTAAATKLIAATTSSASVAITGPQVRIVNGAADCRIEFGTSSTVTVTKPVSGGAAGSLTIKAGSVETLTLPAGTTYIAAACDTGTSNIEFTPVVGL